MECNKEEAIRARDIAEKRMRAKDFVGARKIVIKAQRLFPDLERIFQMLTICDVHCCAEIKVNGETDWYGILQVEQTADEITIKKQYRKLALLLHPDKNKFEGAEAAFKLVGEANRTLSDQTRRSLYDIKRQTVFQTVQARQPPQQPRSRTSVDRKQPGSPINSTSSTEFNTPTQPQREQNPNAPTFWTMCLFCRVRYLYYQEILNKALRCRSCKKQFIAYDLNAVPSRANPSNLWTRTGNLQQETQGPGAHATCQKSSFANAAPGIVFQANVGVGSPSSNPLPKSGPSAGFSASNRDFEDNAKTSDKVKFEKARSQERSKREKEVKPTSGNSRQKQARKMVVESESSVNSYSSDSDVVFGETISFSGQSAGTARSAPQRSGRIKQNISYNEHGDTDFVPHQHKRLRKSGKTYDGDKTDQANFEGHCNGVDNHPSVEKKGSPNGLQEKHDTGEREANMKTVSSSKHSPRVDSAQKTSEEEESLSYPDPEFYNFPDVRSKDKFESGQIWALYSDIASFPNDYGMITKIESGENFRVHVTWLEVCAVTKEEKRWADELSISCGTFKIGSEQVTYDSVEPFSHIVEAEALDKSGFFTIYPKTGEVWALYKNWNWKWTRSTVEDCEYDLVEILSRGLHGVKCEYLAKVGGHRSVFMPKRHSTVEIPATEYLRFSHLVPAFRLTEERGGKLRGYWELDPASIPQILLIIEDD